MDVTMPSSSSLDLRLAKLIRLKDAAIAKNIPIPQETLLGIGELEKARGGSTQALPESEANKLDLLTQALAEATYPITVDNVDRLENGQGEAAFAIYVLAGGLILAVLSGIGIGLVRNNYAPPLTDACKILSSIFLGTLGAVLYVMLPNGRINMYVGLDREMRTNCVARIIIGGILGYVIYLIYPDFFRPPESGKVGLELLYPLIGGYSISLVVGILSRTVTAVELALGINERKNVNALKNAAAR